MNDQSDLEPADDAAQKRMREVLARRSAGTKPLEWTRIDAYHLDGGDSHRVCRVWLPASQRWLFEAWRRTTETRFGQHLGGFDTAAEAKKRCEDDAGTGA